MIWKILGRFVNPLTADDKYSPLNRGNFLQHVQMQLSQERKTFSQFFFACPKLRLNFGHVQTKDDLHSGCVFELTDSEKPG